MPVGRVLLYTTDMIRTVSLSCLSEEPRWRRPIVLLALMAVAMPLSFATWSALLNNFVIEAAGFTGVEIGWLHSIREVPGFLAVGVIAITVFVREQVLGLICLVLLGVATALTAFFPSLGGILAITFLSSIGFHYYETVNQSLQLQWLPKDRAPVLLGRLMAVGSAATLAAYCAIMFTWDAFDLSYSHVYMVAGASTVLLALAAMVMFPQFEAPTPQHRKMVLRKRYWLYYLLQFFAGARRQIFMVFAGFMMVERFGLEVHQLTRLFMITLLVNIFIAPLLGQAVSRFGERNTLIFEYFGLALVFLAYGGIYLFGWGVMVAMVLYVVDHMLFGLAFALKTYFQKIADPADIGPTAAVAFTINHIAAVFLPAVLGYLWLTSPVAVFIFATVLVSCSLCLATLIPRDPAPGRETRLVGVFARA